MIRNLYIIGNGFDCHHNICSSYYAYLDWLKTNNVDVYNEIVRYYPQAVEDRWWGTFENQLGEIELIPLIEQVALENEPDIDDYERDHYIDEFAGANDIKDSLGRLIDNIKQTFYSWIKSLNQADPSQKIVMDVSDSYFVNFNYTLTLEKLYGISAKNVWHIHGSVQSGNFELGHGKSDDAINNDAIEPIPSYNPQKDDPSEYGLDCTESDIKRNTRLSAIDQIKRIRKDVMGIIQRNQSKFSKFSNVEHLYIYGLSFSDVDLPYIKEVLGVIPKDCQITISYFSDKDKRKIVEFMGDLNFNYKLVTLNNLSEA